MRVQSAHGFKRVFAINRSRQISGVDLTQSVSGVAVWVGSATVVIVGKRSIQQWRIVGHSWQVEVRVGKRKALGDGTVQGRKSTFQPLKPNEVPIIAVPRKCLVSAFSREE